MQSVAVDDDNLSWTAGGFVGSSGAILSAPKGGGAVHTLASGLARLVFGVAIDATHAYAVAGVGAAETDLSSTSTTCAPCTSSSRRRTSRARRLAITPAATSNALHRLRVELGDPLLVRVGRTFARTPLADELLHESVRSLGLAGG